MEIRKYVEEILGDGGVAYAGGLSKREEQYRYAIVVAENMERGNRFAGSDKVIDMTSVACVEAATGVGKTIGYLVPLLLDSAITGKRVAVSTYTRALQSQILNEDLPRVVDWVRAVTGKKLTFSLRYGINAYISERRTEAVVGAMLVDKEIKLSSSDRDILKSLLAWARVCNQPKSKAFDASKHTGLFADFLDSHGLKTLPGGLIESKISIQHSDHPEDKYLLERDIKKSKCVDVLVVTHAMMLLNNLRYNKVLDLDRKIEAVVFDEADQLESVASNIYRQDIPLHKAGSILSSVHEHLPVLDDVIRHYELLSELVMTHYESGVKILKPGERFARDLQRQITVLSEALASPKKLCARKAKQNTIAASSRAVLEELVEFASNIEAFSVSLFNVMTQRTSTEIPVVSWSPVRQYPSLQTIPTNPGQLVGRLWCGLKNDDGDASNYIRHALFTSATLGVQNKSREFDYHEFARSIGIIRNSKTGEMWPKRIELQTDLCVAFEPADFGKMLFVLADPRIPKPLKEEKDELLDIQYVHDQRWVNYAVMMINYAMNNPSKKLTYNRTLVLANSYADVSQLEKAMGNTSGMIFHKRGQSLNQHLEKFKSDKNSVLVTPGAWEGLSLPKTIANIVILRMPIGNIADHHSQAMIHYYQTRGMSKQQALSVLFGSQKTHAKRKLKQGMGRGIRCSEDHVRVLIADGRFTVPDKKEYPALITARYEQSLDVDAVKASVKTSGYELAIPSRFRERNEAYEHSHILMLDGTINKLKRFSGAI